MSDQIADSVYEGMKNDVVPEPVDFEKVFRKVIQRAADVIRDRGGVMPEDLPEVRQVSDTYMVGPAGPVDMTIMRPVSDDQLWAANLRAEALALLAIAQKIEEDRS